MFLAGSTIKEICFMTISYLKNHDHSVETFVDLKHVSIINLMRMNSVLRNGTHILAFLPVSCWATLPTGFAIKWHLLKILWNVLQDSIHVLFAQKEFSYWVNLIKDLLEPDFISWRKRQRSLLVFGTKWISE